jgi:cobalt/nickel transport system permease protein
LGQELSGIGGSTLHIHDGVLTGPFAGPILLGGAAVAAGGVAIGLWRLDEEKIPQTGVVAAALFVASIIHVPVGPSSAHLMLVGLAGVLLGWAVFPAVLIALLLQAILFPWFGGLTTLGLNTLAFAVPALLCHYLFGWALRALRRTGTAVFLVGFGAGLTGMMLSCFVYSGFLLLGGEGFGTIVGAVLLLHLAVLPVEGFITGTIAVSLKRLRPEIFGSLTLAGAKECPHG